MAVMLGGTYLMTSLFIPALLKSKDPRVINISSGGAYATALNLDNFNSEYGEYDGTKVYSHVKRA